MLPIFFTREIWWRLWHCINLNANKTVGRGICGWYSNIDKCRPEAAGDAISGAFVGPFVLDKCLKCRDPSFNRSREIPPEAIGNGIFDSFFRYNSRPEENNDVVSGVAVDNVGMDADVKFCDSRSNGFVYIREADFRVERTWRSISQYRAKHLVAFRPKMNTKVPGGDAIEKKQR